MVMFIKNHGLKLRRIKDQITRQSAETQRNNEALFPHQFSDSLFW